MYTYIRVVVPRPKTSRPKDPPQDPCLQRRQEGDKTVFESDPITVPKILVNLGGFEIQTITGTISAKSIIMLTSPIHTYEYIVGNTLLLAYHSTWIPSIVAAS